MQRTALASSSSSAAALTAAAGPRRILRGPAVAPPRRHNLSRSVSVAAAEKAPSAAVIHPLYSKLKPRADYLLCDVADIEKNSKSGLNTSSEQQTTISSSGGDIIDAVALGHGFSAAACDFSATLRQFRLKCGDTVLYSMKDGKGCIDVTMGGDPHVMLHDSKVIGILPGPAAATSGGDVAKLRPFGDRVLFKVQPNVIDSIALPDSARGNPVVAGVVVAVGPGKRAGAHAKWPDARTAVGVAVGEKVACLEGVGEELVEAAAGGGGQRYVVVHEGDILK